MKPCLLFVMLLSLPLAWGKEDYGDLDSEAHQYWTRQLRDPFSLRLEGIRDGSVPLDRSGEQAFVISLLKALDVPVASQLLVFSTTSLQLSLISPRNPRAIYFNEEIYVGYVPGGRIEIISMDPELGGIFYIFDIPRPGSGDRPMVFERSDRCMNCHSDTETRGVPGLTLRSVIPGPRGGSMDAFRRDQNGHEIPFDQRYGGWHVTGEHGIRKHWGNVIGNFEKGELITSQVAPGEQFNFARYPAATSDILPHLVIEHQAGFVNRVLEASYRARAYSFASGGKFTPEQEAALDRVAGEIVRYLLFADEAEFPAGGVAGDAAFIEAFLGRKKADPGGRSLRDLELRSRMFKYRCSYMIYSNVFRGMPEAMRARVFSRLAGALSTGAAAAGFDYLPDEEKQAIRSILRATLPGW